MPTLMISLDKKILDPTSPAAQRMIVYGQQDPLTIIVPSDERKRVQLSPDVVVYAPGGQHRFEQYREAYRTAKQVMGETQYDWVTTQDPFLTGLLGVFLKKKFHTKLMIQCHGDFFGSSYYRDGSALNRLRYWLARLVVIRQADRIRVVSERLKASLLGLGIAADQIVVRPIAIDMQAVRAHVTRVDLHTKYPEYKKIFLVLGRLDPVKNIAWLIEHMSAVIAREPKALLLIVGHGDEQEKLEQVVRDNKLSHHVRFETWTDDPLSYLKTADALLFPSLSEGYGLVVMEAIAVGTPVIMNDVGVANFEAKATSLVHIIPLSDPTVWVDTMLSL